LTIKKYRPAPFVPTTSVSGLEDSVVIAAENMWLRFGRMATVYAEGYTGNQDVGKTIPHKTLTGTLSWVTTSRTVTGVGTSFLSELHLGSFVLGDGGAGATELFVVEEIVSNTSFIASRAPTADSTGTPSGYVLPVIFPVGRTYGTAVRGNVVQFPKGTFLGVGDGEFQLEGTSLSSALNLSRTPRFALYDPATNTYTQDNVGIARPIVPPTLTSTTEPVNSRTVTGATNASPIVITTGGGHLLHTGQTVSISGVGGNTAANGEWVVTVLTSTTFSLNGSTGNGAYGGGGTITRPQSGMLAGGYNIRIVRRNTKTEGYSQPSDVIGPVVIPNFNYITITFKEAMVADQDAYDIYGSVFEDNSTTTIEKQFMGPWFYITTVTAEMLQTTAKPTGREVDTTFTFSYTDAEIVALANLLSFNNFQPVDAEFVDLINGIPIYFSCQGKGNASSKSTSPGPAAVPSKPSNPEAVFLNKTITTAGGDTIIGEFNAKSRIYALCQNTLQTLILTTLDEEPITFRSLWNSGFRNPYNVAFVKEYLYGFSTQKIVRSVAGGDDSAMEFEFASDIKEYVNDWETGHVLTAYDPKNRAVCFFYSAAERRSGYWVTIVLPFLLDRQVWSCPIVLKKADTDFIVSGVATIGESLYFTAGGRTSGGTIESKVYIFDGGDSETKDWYMAWNFVDDGAPTNPKTLKGHTVNGRLASSGTDIKIYGMGGEGAFALTNLAAGTSANETITVGATSGLARKRFKFLDTKPYSNYSVRMSGSYTTTPDRLDSIAIDVTINNSQT